MDDDREQVTATVVLVTAAAEQTVARIATPCGLALVDTLARLHLEAHRHGVTIRVADASRDLCDLLDLVGLADVLRPTARPAG